LGKLSLACREWPRDGPRRAEETGAKAYLRAALSSFTHLGIVVSGGLWNVCRFNESLGLNVSQFVVCYATEMYRFLAVRDAGTAVREMPLENWKPDTLEPMHLPVRIDE
jgi:hypothetical protein